MNKKPISTLLLAAAFLLFNLAAPGVAAESERKEKGIYGSLNLSDAEYRSIETSAELHDQMQRRGLRHNDSYLDEWLQEIGDRLVPVPTDYYQEYRFYLIRDPSPNAFALPNGNIYVHTGLICRLENEAQLASLLSHEIIHVAGHHSVLAYRSQKRKAVLGGFLSILGALAGGWGEVGGYLMNYGLATSVFGYSRDLEQEADVKGSALMLDAGYDIREMPTLFEILSQDYEGLNPRMNGKWNSHPDLASRGQYTAALAAETATENLNGLSLGSDDFRSRVRPLAIDTVRDYIVSDYPKTALELAQSLIEEDAKYAAGWVAQGHSYVALGAKSEYTIDAELTRKEKKAQVKLRSKLTREELRSQAEASPEAKANIAHNYAEAEKSYLHALELDSTAAEAHAGLGEIYLRREMYRESARELVTYIRLRPDAPDKGIVMDDLREIAQVLKTESGE
jgi:predicted Zn-dependent protease